MAKSDDEEEEESKEEGFTTFQSFIDLLSREELEECLRLLIPIIKLGVSIYLIGTKKVQLLVKNTNLIVRVGGGFMDLNEYLRRESKTECLKIDK